MEREASIQAGGPSRVWGTSRVKKGSRQGITTWHRQSKTEQGGGKRHGTSEAAQDAESGQAQGENGLDEEGISVEGKSSVQGWTLSRLGRHPGGGRTALHGQG